MVTCIPGAPLGVLKRGDDCTSSGLRWEYGQSSGYRLIRASGWAGEVTKQIRKMSCISAHEFSWILEISTLAD